MTLTAPTLKEGTTAEIEESVQVCVTAVIPPKSTVPGVVPKFEPDMRTEVPTRPTVGEIKEMEGAGIEVNFATKAFSEPVRTVWSEPEVTGKSAALVAPVK